MALESKVKVKYVLQVSEYETCKANSSFIF